MTEERSNQSTAFALSLDEIPGEKEPISWGVFPLMGTDSLYVRWDGGGGYGDPLERDPEAVLADCRQGVVSRDVARGVYGVVVDERLAAVDAAATEQMRGSLRSARMAQRAAE